MWGPPATSAHVGPTSAIIIFAAHLLKHTSRAQFSHLSFHFCSSLSPLRFLSSTLRSRASSPNFLFSCLNFLFSCLNLIITASFEIYCRGTQMFKRNSELIGMVRLEAQNSEFKRLKTLSCWLSWPGESHEVQTMSPGANLSIYANSNSNSISIYVLIWVDWVVISIYVNSIWIYVNSNSHKLIRIRINLCEFMLIRIRINWVVL